MNAVRPERKPYFIRHLASECSPRARVDFCSFPHTKSQVRSFGGHFTLLTPQSGEQLWF